MNAIMLGLLLFSKIASAMLTLASGDMKTAVMITILSSRSINVGGTVSLYNHAVVAPIIMHIL